MAGSDYLSVHGGFNGEEEAPVARTELRQLGNSLLEAMERMFNEHLPVQGERPPQHEEFDENSGFGNRFHDRFGNGRGGGRHADFDHHGGGRRADFHEQCRGGCGRDLHVHFDDEDEAHDDYDEGFVDNDNPFAQHGHFGQPHEHRRGADHDGENHHGHRNRDDPGSARVKLSVPKFSGREDADAYLEWEEQCDQIFRVHNLSD
jgi:hypothetical protein